MNHDDSIFETQPQAVLMDIPHKRFSIGLPASQSGSERRFPLTPEAVAQLIGNDFSVYLQAGAADIIHYTDAQYERAGARIVTRKEALGCDIVIHLSPLTSADIRMMRRGAMLLTLLHPKKRSAASIKELLSHNILSVAIDEITDNSGHPSFADILAEVDGRASIAAGASLLANVSHGKGILLGGVTGIVPCEVTVIGSGIAARAAAMSAMGMGASVRMFDNDIYSLREGSSMLGSGIVTSVLHPRVLENAFRTADIVISTRLETPYQVNADQVAVMKKGVIVMDLDYDNSPAFPSLPVVDISLPSSKIGGRLCYTCLGNTVPRTAAMALSNTFVKLMQEIMTCEGVTHVLNFVPGLQNAVITFLGKAVNKKVAEIAGVRAIDISILLNCS